MPMLNPRIKGLIVDCKRELNSAEAHNFEGQQDIAIEKLHNIRDMLNSKRLPPKDLKDENP